MIPHLLCCQTLIRDDLQQGDGVTVVPLEHFSDDGEKVPHALGLPPPQRSQERGPLRCHRGSSGAQVVDITAGRQPSINNDMM